MIKPSQCIYIKLGQRGEFEADCIEKDHSIRLDYKQFDHKACLKGDWDKVLDICRQNAKNEGAAKNHLSQIRMFYESDVETLWFTFYKGKLFYTFVESEIILLDDNTKIRRSKTKWSSKDANGNDLFLSSLSGKLTRTKGFRGTVNRSRVTDYIVQRINGISPPNTLRAIEDLSKLEDSLEKLIQELAPQDFELLVEVIFSNTGWIRIGDAGKQEKDIDLELLSPVMNERVAVQIKSKTTQAELNDYAERIDSWGLSKFFFVFHSADQKLSAPQLSQTEIKLVDSKQLAKLVVSAGVINWLIERTS